METNFLNKLYEIKPFKVVNSPESTKYPSNLTPAYPDNQEKQNQQTFTKISQSDIFNNLSQSIDNLFSKIQKIKMEFDCPNSSADRSNKSIHQTSSNSKQSSIKQQKLENIQNQKSISNKNTKSYNKNRLIQHNFQCSPFMDDQNDQITLSKHFSDSSARKIYHPQLNPLHKVRSIEQKPHIFYFSQNQNKFQGLSMRQFQLGKCVGSGKFGDVHICKHKPTNSLFGLKKIFKSTIKEYNMVQQFIKQLKIHYFLDHPNVIKLYSFFQDEYHVFLLMEYAQGGSLYEKFIQKREDNIDEQKVSQTIFQVLNSVSYLHRNNILHRDIKPENIVITQENQIKVCDFGWSAIFDNQMKKTFCGTLDYLSPQMKDRGAYTTSVDIWSIGILTFELLTGFGPFKNQIDKMKRRGLKQGQNQIKGKKWEWNNIIFPQHISKQAQNFIESLLQQDPDQRLSIRECLRHPFITKYNQNQAKTQTDENQFNCIL